MNFLDVILNEVECSILTYECVELLMQCLPEIGSFDRTTQDTQERVYIFTIVINFT